MDVFRCVFKHNVGWPRGFDAVPPHHASPVPMLESDDRGIRIRRVMATLPGARNEGGFRCFEPDADERHRDVNRDTLDGLPVTGPCVDGVDDCAVSVSDCSSLRARPPSRTRAPTSRRNTLPGRDGRAATLRTAACG